MERGITKQYNVIVTWAELRQWLELPPDALFLNAGLVGEPPKGVPDPTGEAHKLIFTGYVPDAPAGLVLP